MDKITQSGGKAFSIQADLTQKGEIERVFKAGREWLGGAKFDFAINTAGTSVCSAR